MNKTGKVQTKSPVTKKPLRYAGQSLDEQINDLIDHKLLQVLVGLGVLFSLTINDWIHYFQQKVPNPFIPTILLVLAIIASFYILAKHKEKLRNFKQGRDGEKEVGFILEDLRELGVKVYHDIIGDGFNLDHVLVCEKGIFVIETKTYSKPMEGKANVAVKGEKLIFNGEDRGDKPIIQAKAGANWLKNLLKEETGIEFQVNPVVLLVGWFVDTPVKYQKDIWVFHPKGFDSYFRKFIEITHPLYSKEDIAMINSRIKNYIRAKNIN